MNLVLRSPVTLPFPIYHELKYNIEWKYMREIKSIMVASLMQFYRSTNLFWVADDSRVSSAMHAVPPPKTPVCPKIKTKENSQ